MSHWSGKSGSAASFAGMFSRSASGGPMASMDEPGSFVPNPPVEATFATRSSFESVSRNAAESDRAMTTPIWG
jgi:hypothetical protein